MQNKWWITKIDQSKVKLVTSTIHEAMTEARNKALSGETSYVMDNSGNVYMYYPTGQKSPFYPTALWGYGVHKYNAPTSENLNMQVHCYSWS